MVVERRDNRFITAYKTRNACRLIYGDRTWTILKPGEKFYLSPLMNTLIAAIGTTKILTLDNIQPDTIHYSEEYTFKKDLRQYRSVRDEEINNPLQPWFGKLRQRTI